MDAEGLSNAMMAQASAKLPEFAKAFHENRLLPKLIDINKLGEDFAKLPDKSDEKLK